MIMKEIDRQIDERRKNEAFLDRLYKRYEVERELYKRLASSDQDEDSK